MNKLLLSLFCILSLAACSDSDNEKGDDNGGIHHHYRAEVEFDDAKDNYMIQVGFLSMKTVEDKELKDHGRFNIGEELASDALYTPRGDLLLIYDPYNPGNLHNYTFNKKNIFSTAEKVASFQIIVTMNAPSPTTSSVVKIRIYKDDKLIDESRSEVNGGDTNPAYFYSKLYHDENLFD